MHAELMDFPLLILTTVAWNERMLDYRWLICEFESITSTSSSSSSSILKGTCYLSSGSRHPLLVVMIGALEILAWAKVVAVGC